MQNKMTRGELRVIADTDHVQCGDAATMANMLLELLDQKPVAYIGERMLDSMTDGARSCGRVWHNSIDEISKESRIPLYAAPPAPVAVHDERAAFESFMAERFGDCIEDRRQVKNGDGEYMAWDMQVAWIVWQRRAAMLNAGPVTEATVPDGWKLVPVEPTEAMLNDADAYRAITLKDIWSALLAAAPAAPAAPDNDL